MYTMVDTSAPTISRKVAAPVKQNKRIVIIDAVRGIALLGILLMNIPYFGLPYQMAENLNIRGEYSGINYYTYWIVDGFFSGTMRGLFSMLFGAGAVLLLDRLEKKKDEINPADIYYRRLIYLLLFGLINAFVFLWPGDILYSYAICGLFLFPFRNVRPAYLLLIGGLFIAFHMLTHTLDLKEQHNKRIQGLAALTLEKKGVPLTNEQQLAKEEWTQYQDKNKVENVQQAAQKEVVAMQKGYFSVMGHLKEINIKLETVKFYGSYFFDIMAFLFIGMALYKWRVLTGEASFTTYWLMCVCGYVIGILLSYYILSSIIAVRFDFSMLYNRLTIDLYQVRRLALTMGHIGFLMLLYKHKIATRVFKYMANVGQMAFTNYLMQSIICMFIFYGVGFGLFGQLERYQLYYVVAAIWLFQIVFSAVWLRYFRFGPFEWVWRSLTYFAKQPIKRRNNNQTVEQSAVFVP